MKRCVSPFAVLLVAGFFVFAACDDPASVGTDLISERVSPQVDTLQLADFTPADRVPKTGNTSRVLMGIVDDPELGLIEATGYINFVRSEDELESPNTPVDSVIVEFEPNYLYGDSTSAMTLFVHEITSAEEWSGSDAPADTSLEVGELVGEATYTASDSLVSVRLFDDWVAENEDLLTLNPEEFNDAFRGFRLTAERNGVGAVLGADMNETRLRIHSAGLTETTLTPSDRITALERRGGVTLPEGVVLFQDGIPSSPDVNAPNGAAIRVDFNTDELRSAVLNGAELRVHINVEVLDSESPDFQRPRSDRLSLVAVDSNGDVVFADAGTPLLDIRVFLMEDGELRFRDPDQNSELSFRRYLQQKKLATLPSEVEGLELRIPDTDNTIDAVLLIGPGSDPEREPRIFVTLSDE